MAVKALYDYNFPSADRAVLFGDDELVYVHWPTYRDVHRIRAGMLGRPACPKYWTASHILTVRPMGKTR